MNCADRGDRTDEVADPEHPAEGVLQLHVSDRADHGETERQQYRAPPWQAASLTDDGTRVPGNGYLVGVGIALPIANGGHRATR